jgi:hypothetical protein
MATLTPQVIKLTGLEAIYGACAAGGDQFITTGRTLIHVKNGHSSPQSVSATFTATCNHGVAAEVKTVEVTNAEDRFIGPFLIEWFANSLGYVSLSYTGVTALTIAVLELDADGI